MEFIINLTRREIRSSWRRLIFFFVCIAIGVGSIVGLRSLVQNLSRAVGGDARALLTADLVIRSTSNFSPDQISRIEELISDSNIVEDQTETLATSAMARPTSEENRTLKFVSLMGIETRFPLVGEFKMPNGEAFDHSLLEENGAIVAPILLEELDVEIGDSINIGSGEFTIRGTFDEEPGGSGGFRFGTRVYITKSAFEESGILQNRSRVSRRILFRTSDDPTALVDNLREKLKGTTLRIRSYKETEERLAEQFTRTEDYLALSGLLILVLGGVGVWNVARVFVEQQRKSVAVLKCLGAGGTRIIFVYILQILILGILGSVFGVLLAQAALWFAKFNFNDVLPGAMSYSISYWIAIQGVFIGILISLLFSALPLLQVRGIKPNLLLRDENNEKLRRLDWTKWAFGIATLSGLLGLAAWQAGSFAVGAIFLVGVAAVSLFLYASASALMWLLRRTRIFNGFSIRQAINSLHRPGNQTRIILLAVGLGAFVVLTVQSLQSNMVREFDLTRNEKLPSLFFIDIQKSQIDEFSNLVESGTGEEPETIPTVRARIAYINGEPIDYDDPTVRQQQGRIGREFAVSYRTELKENETIIEGAWWADGEGEVPQVSVEERMAKVLEAGVGDSITFDVSGRLLTAQIANIRKLDLKNTRTAFVFIFRPGLLEKAPQTFLANVLKRIPAKDRQRLQRDIVDKFPNVQIFDVAEIVKVFQNVVANFVLAISFVGGFVILSGVLILIGSVALTKSQRFYENAILKTLGADRFTLAKILIAEYGILGVLAGLIGGIFGTVLSYIVAEYVLKLEWEFDPILTLVGILVTAFLVTLIGVIASFDVIFRKPLSTLRSG